MQTGQMLAADTPRLTLRVGSVLSLYIRLNLLAPSTRDTVDHAAAWFAFEPEAPMRSDASIQGRMLARYGRVEPAIVTLGEHDRWIWAAAVRWRVCFFCNQQQFGPPPTTPAGPEHEAQGPAVASGMVLLVDHGLRWGRKWNIRGWLTARPACWPSPPLLRLATVWFVSRWR